MSLNQLTNPNSSFDLYGKSLTVESVTVPDMTGIITADEALTARFDPDAPLTIVSHARKYGSQYTVFCRAKGTAIAGAPATIKFNLNIPGFSYINGQEETAHVTRHTAQPAFVTANAYGLIVEGVQDGVTSELQIKEEVPAGTVQLALQGGAAGAFDIAFTITVLGPS